MVRFATDRVSFSVSFHKTVTNNVCVAFSSMQALQFREIAIVFVLEHHHLPLRACAKRYTSRCDNTDRNQRAEGLRKRSLFISMAGQHQLALSQH